MKNLLIASYNLLFLIGAFCIVAGFVGGLLVKRMRGLLFAFAHSGAAVIVLSAIGDLYASRRFRAQTLVAALHQQIVTEEGFVRLAPRDLADTALQRELDQQRRESVTRIELMQAQRQEIEAKLASGEL